MWGSNYQTWRIEVDGWGGLERPKRRQTLRLVGDHAGEWWGRGHFEFANSSRAYDCATQLRDLGLKARVILRVR